MSKNQLSSLVGFVGGTVRFQLRRVYEPVKWKTINKLSDQVQVTELPIFVLIFLASPVWSRNDHIRATEGEDIQLKSEL